jgi:FKBP-type peptidyl-prolyl cis-trans isomerase FklB
MVEAGNMDSYNKRTGAKYLATTLAQKEGIIELKSGMLIEIVSESTLKAPMSPREGDSCDVTYSGTFKDGTPFDSGRTSFAPNQVIRGWTEAMQYMVEGDKWILHIPYDLAYGERGSPPKIPGFSVLVFEIEIHKVVGGAGKSKEEAQKMLAEGTALKTENEGL